MERKVEFRIKDGDGKWHYGSPVFFDDGSFEFFDKDKLNDLLPYEQCGVEIAINRTLGQYVGLKDKNGNKIYEGDIVKFLDSDSYDETFENAGVVEYCDNGFYITNRYSVDMEDLVYGSEGIIECEVLGNVYDNKDLLN